MLIDEARITIKGGNGGDGLVHFYSDAFRPKGGPDGGKGGDGGNLYFKVALISFVIPKNLPLKMVKKVVPTIVLVGMAKMLF